MQEKRKSRGEQTNWGQAEKKQKKMGGKDREGGGQEEEKEEWKSGQGHNSSDHSQ